MDTSNNNHPGRVSSLSLRKTITKITKEVLCKKKNPGKVPEELQELTDIEEMLIAQVFTVMSFY
jgi:hypothetical protein